MTITGLSLAMLLGIGGGIRYAEGEVAEPPTSEVTEITSEISDTTPTANPTDSTEPSTEPTEPTEPSTDGEKPSEETPSEEETFDWIAWAKEFLSPQVITTITTLLAFLATIIKLAYSLKDLKKKNQLTVEAVNDLVINEMKKIMPEEISSNIDKYMPDIVAYEKKSNDIMIAFSKILALAQENTPEARTAILNIIQELGILNNTTIESAKETIAKQETAKKEEADKKAEEVQKVIEETSKETSKGDEYNGTSI